MFLSHPDKAVLSSNLLHQHRGTEAYTEVIRLSSTLYKGIILAITSEHHRQAGRCI